VTDKAAPANALPVWIRHCVEQTGTVPNGHRMLSLCITPGCNM